MFSLKFITGAAIGYVAGTAAGRERFEQLKQQFQKLTGTETVQQLQSDLGSAAGRAQQVVTEKVQEKSGKISGRGDGDSSSSGESDFASSGSDFGTTGTADYGSTSGLAAPPLTSSGTSGLAGDDIPPATSDLGVDEPLIPGAGTSQLDPDPLTGGIGTSGLDADGTTGSGSSSLDPDPLASEDDRDQLS